MDGVVIRAAGEHDSQALFDWRNDEHTRAASGDRGEIDRDAHEAWFTRSLTSTTRRIYLAELADDPAALVGMVRFDDDGASTEVSINLNPGFRGRGLAGAVLSAAIAADRRLAGGPVRLAARIRPENEASARLFASAGFRRAGSDGEFDRYEL